MAVAFVAVTPVSGDTHHVVVTTVVAISVEVKTYGGFSSGGSSCSLR